MRYLLLPTLDQEEMLKLPLEVERQGSLKK